MNIAVAIPVVLLLLAVATVWYCAIRIAAKDDAARDAALGIETARAVQSQRAAYDAPGVAESAAQDVPKRKHRKVL